MLNRMKYNIHINILKTVSGQLESNRPLERPMYREVANNKMNLIFEFPCITNL